MLIIHTTTQDVDTECLEVPHPKEAGRSVLKTTLVVSGILFLGALPFAHTAGASFFSLFSFKKDTLSLQVDHGAEAIDPVDAGLLRPMRTFETSAPRGGGSITILDDSVLSPDSAPFSSVAEEKKAPAAPDQISLYLVQEGDTLSQVAELFDVSVNTIVWANELASNKDIHPGQTLLILPISGVQHTVEKGDTLRSIAKEYGGGTDDLDALIEEIMEFNSLSEGASLAVGQTITIPGGMIEEEAPASATYTRAVATNSGPDVSGYFIHPLPGAVRTQGIHGYNGVDYGAPVGTPIRASAAGKVIVSRVGSWNGGYGNYVVIDHPNGTQTLYAHNSKNVVWQGQNIVAGQIIGYVGSTGRSTGPHLHFEVRGAKNPF